MLKTFFFILFSNYSTGASAISKSINKRYVFSSSRFIENKKNLFLSDTSNNQTNKEENKKSGWDIKRKVNYSATKANKYFAIRAMQQRLKEELHVLNDMIYNIKPKNPKNKNEWKNNNTRFHRTPSRNNGKFICI